MVSEFSIPTFRPGQRVRVSREPVEFGCPKCHSTWHLREDVTATIITVGERLAYCGKCNTRGVPLGEGWYGVKPDSGEAFVAPWTRLEALDG